MSYTITYKDETESFYMFGESQPFIGNHLETIGKLEKVKDVDDAVSESHMLAILNGHGIQVNLLDEDGSPLDY